MNNKITLIFFHPHFTSPGGAGNVVLESASRLDPDKYNVHLVCIRADRQYKKQYPFLSFIEIKGPLSSHPLFWFTFPWVQYKIHRVLKRLSPDIMLPNVLPANWWAFIYKIFHPEVLCLWQCHEPSAFIHMKEWIEALSNPYMKCGVKFLYPFLKAMDFFLVARGPDYVFGNSLYSARLFNKVYHKQINEILYPGVDLDFFIHRENKKPYLFILSRLSKFKNVGLAIEAMQKIKPKEYQLLIGGEGVAKEELIRLTRQLGLSDRVRFLGGVPYKDLPRLYGEAKLVLFTSRSEPFGMVPVEALASGTPVIGSNSGGLKETVVNNRTGILLEEINPDHLARVVNDLLSDPERYQFLQKNARKSVEKFNWENHVKKLEHILEETIAK